jgi:proteic killer suppression protein
LIASFRSKTLERFWWKGEKKRVEARHAKRLTVRLTALDIATVPEDMIQPGFAIHRLTGDQTGRCAVKVGKDWRLTFGWSDQ